MMTPTEFAALTPFTRGYVVAMIGGRQSEPNVPDEANPYPADSADSRRWMAGYYSAMAEMQEEALS